MISQPSCCQCHILVSSKYKKSYFKRFKRRTLRLLLKNLSLQEFSLIVRLLFTQPFGLDMVGNNINNTLIDDSDMPPPGASDRLGKTMDSGSPLTQKYDVQEVNEDIRQTQYHFQNCGTVYMDSYNARGVRMENCGNHVPQVICS